MRRKRSKKKISKCNNYRIGRNFEYRVKRYYEKLGYFVVRSYASKGAADLYCMKPYSSIAYRDFFNSSDTELKTTTQLLLIQCKNYKGRLPETEQNALRVMAKLTGGRAIHVFKDKQRKLHFVEIRGKEEEAVS